MSRLRPFTLLALVLFAVPALSRVSDPRPVGQLRHAPTGGYSLAPELAWNGSWLVSWSGGEGAARLNDEGAPLDVPAIYLGASSSSAGVGNLPLDDGWLIGSIEGGVDPWLALDRIDAAGKVISRVGHPIPLELNFRAARVARSGEVLALAASWVRQSGQQHDTTRIFLVGSAQAPLEVEGGALVDFVSTSEGFTLVLADRVLRLDPQLRVLGIALAHADSPILGVASDSDGKVVLSSNGAAIGVHEVTDAGLTLVASMVTPFPARVLRGAYSGETLLIAWKAATDSGVYYGAYDMFAARIAPNGSIDGPVIIEKGTDHTNRYSGGATPFDLEGDAHGWMIARSAGSWPPTHAFLDIVTRRLERHAPLTLFEGAPTVVSWRATDQYLIGEASTGDTTLVAWAERTLSTLAIDYRYYAARYDSGGELLDPGELSLPFSVQSVVAVKEGFLLFGQDVHLLAHGSSELEKVQVSRTGYEQIVCGTETCLRAWIRSTNNQYEIRVAKVGETPSGSEGILVDSSAHQILDLSMATNGTDFFLAWKSPVENGTILRSAIVQTSGELRADVSNFVAVPSPVVLQTPVVFWTGTEYVAIWRHDLELRTMRFTREGASIDGGETEWTGRPTGVRGFVRGVFHREDGPVVLISEDQQIREYSVTPQGMLVPETPPAPSSCETAGRCLRFTSLEVTGDPWYRAWRIFLQTETRSDRRRPAGR